MLTELAAKARTLIHKGNKVEEFKGKPLVPIRIMLDYKSLVSYYTIIYYRKTSC